MLSESDFQNATLGNQTWRYYDSGEGRPVVLAHGFPDTPHSWAGIAASLNQAGYRTILPYLRGYHPDTLVPGRPYDALHVAEDAIGLLDALGLESAVLVGHDWGATLVYGAAALAPDRIQGVVPIAIPHPRTLKPKNALQALGMLVMARHFLYFQLPWAEAGTRRSDFRYIDTLYRRWAPGWHGPERDAAVARAREAFATPEVLTGAIDWYRAMGAKVDRRLTAPIKCGGLMVAGGKDFGGHLGPYKKSQGMRSFDSWRSSRKKTFPGS
ncbi:MAG: alpha/beta fold hydrolase [Deltaproteobacteria bacterium]|nr:alpha/beta fold hydrolase [Deltaproteobacteria bacterium]